MMSKHIQSLLQIVVLLCLAAGVTCPRSFCSPMCANKGCDGNTMNDCNGKCSTNWVVSGNSCTPNNTNNLFLHQSTNDIASIGGLTVSPNNTASTFCNSFSLYGPFITADTVTVSGSPINVPFYQLIIYLGIQSMDAGWSHDYWNNNMEYQIQFADPSTVFQTNTYRLYGSTRTEREQYCYRGSSSEYWHRISQSYTYNLTGNSFTWTIKSLEPNNASATWGFRQFIVTYRKCDWRCIDCFGGSNSQCSACLDNGTHTMFQSGTTCDTTCAPGYGQVTGNNSCILCDLYCLLCQQLSTNCSSCVKSGTYTSYLYQANSSCLVTCPDGYYANKANQTCQLCGGNCLTCLNTDIYCTSCPVYYGYANHVCYQPCPNGYYNNSNGLNCTACSPYCVTCLGPSTLCDECVTTSPYVSYLYNTTNNTGSCQRNCPQGWYPETFSGTGPNLCLACDAVCTVCTGNPDPCSICAVGYYLYQSSCIYPCPTDYFQYNSTSTGQCLSCAVYCVHSTIDMYFPSITNSELWVDIAFTWKLDYSTFDMTTYQAITIESGEYAYTLDMFNVTYTAVSQSLYRIKIVPKSYIFLYNATFVVTTRDYNNVKDYSQIRYPFAQTNYAVSSSKNWFLINGPPLSDLEVNVMTSFSRLATKTNDLLSKPYIQEIKKSGVFNLLFSGAQITSCSILSNQIQSQNLYQGVRFWAVFVFFDAPGYEQISNQTKRFVSPTVQNQIRNAQQLRSQHSDQTSRTLFSTDTMYWRFQRTGQTSFFIYDCYIPVFLILLCWVMLFVAYKCQHMHWHSRHAGKIYSATHKIHQISLLYILMASIVEFIYFQPTSTQRYVSAAVCILFNVYFVIYELYIYYDMLRYPMAEIGNRLYDYYVMRYGCFLKNIRYVQYDINEEWSVRHWFRPYNYHFLSYYKKFIMIIALPLFYNLQYAQMGILLAVQTLQIVRLWNTWPFVSSHRNYIRLSLEVALFLFFLVNIIQINLLNTIQSGDMNQLQGTIRSFYALGWAGFLFCFYFNIMFVIFAVYDLCIGLRASNREKMDNARKKYYYDKIKQYEKDNEEASKDLVNRWVRLGNINNSYYGQLPQINVRIEEYSMRMTLGKFEVGVRKIGSLRMMKPKSHRKKNNTVTSKKIEKKRIVEKHAYPQLHAHLYAIYKEHSNNHVQQVVLKTFINVFQQDFAEGEVVPLDRSNMFQRVDMISFDNQRQEKELDEMIEGFPLPEHLFDNF